MTCDPKTLDLSSLAKILGTEAATLLANNMLAGEPGVSLLIGTNLASVKRAMFALAHCVWQGPLRLVGMINNLDEFEHMVSGASNIPSVGVMYAKTLEEGLERTRSLHAEWEVAIDSMTLVIEVPADESTPTRFLVFDKAIREALKASYVPESFNMQGIVPHIVSQPGISSSKEEKSGEQLQVVPGLSKPA